MSYLNLENVAKSYGAQSIIRNINLDINEGEFIVFVGPSGCGKSTLLRMISGLESISDGRMVLDGKVLNDLEPADRGVAMVFQSYALYPHLSVRDNMGFSLRMNHVKKAERNAKVQKAAEILQLEDLLDRKPSQLSGGQKQRVAIGRAIVREPKLFLFDEPLSNLDAELRVVMRAEILMLHQRLKNTMIYVTHDQVEAMTLADRIVVLKGGDVQQFGTPLELYDDPDNLFVAGFIGTPKMNILSAQVEAEKPGQARFRLTATGEVLTVKTPLDLSGHDTVTLGIRPDKIQLAASGKAMITARLDYIEELGETTYIHTVLPDGTRFTALKHGARIDNPAVSGLSFDAADIYLFDADGNRIRPR